MTEPERDPDQDSGGLPSDPDEVWRSIVENYGERPELDEPEPEPPAPALEPVSLDALDEAEFGQHEEEHFIPPPPPPVPRPHGLRAVAWGCLVGVPVAFLLSIIVHYAIPSPFTALLVGAFVGGFVYLIATMRKDADDGWDDGAVV